MRSTWYAERIVFLVCFAAAFFFLGAWAQEQFCPCPKVQRILPAVAIRDSACLTQGQIKRLVYQTAKECQK